MRTRERTTRLYDMLKPLKKWMLLSVAVALVPIAGAQTAERTDSVITVHAPSAHTISRYIYGHFSEHLGRCIYGGYWVGEESAIPNINGVRKDVIEALRNIKAPVIRWPGGCFADTYHWKDAVGPREQRKPIINVHWGMVLEDNSFGTHEFLNMCEQIGAEPYICANVGSGSVQEFAQWVEYTTYDGNSAMAQWRRTNGREKPWKVQFWGIGNENWGCGGNMTPEYYANLYRRFATYAYNYSGNRVFKIACGANAWDFNWTEVLMREAGRFMDGLSLHYYCGSGRRSRSATVYEEDDWFWLLRNAARIDELLDGHIRIMERYDRKGQVKLIVDEWGTWHQVEPGTNPAFLYQQNTIRDALVAGIYLNSFNRHCHRVYMANIAQTINVLQALILTDGPRMILTPTYHVFDLYKVHMDATYVPTSVACAEYRYENDRLPQLDVSASLSQDGSLNVSICNLDPHRASRVNIRLETLRPLKVSGRVLTATDIRAHNTFEQPNQVVPTTLEEIRLADGGVVAVVPPMSVSTLTIQTR